MSKELHLQLTREFSAPNYSPLEVIISEGKGVWVSDIDGHKYLDMLSAYSALNFGHRNERIHKRALAQMNRLTLTSRAFMNDVFGPCCKALAELSRKEMVLMMNSGAEAVETAIKGARRWGYRVKGIEKNKAEIICFNRNFHGRTTTVVSASDSDSARADFGPYMPGFVLCPFGDIETLETLITPHTAAILFEPIQGEGGINIPDDGYLQGIRSLCDTHNILMISDEIQTGLCRTGRVFAIDHEGVEPDIYIIGKSLGGGLMPVSAIAGNKDVLSLFTPGSHGSTFGGNPLACAIAHEVVRIINEEKPQERAAELGDYFMSRVRAFESAKIKEVRGRGLLIGIEFLQEAGPAKKYCKLLMKEGVLCKDTRSQTMRIAPPLIIEKEELDFALSRIENVVS